MVPVGVETHLVPSYTSMEKREDLLEIYSTEDNYQSSPFFICEGRWVVEALLASPYEVHSVVLVEGQHQDLLEQIPPGVPVISITGDAADAMLGFHFHRGVLAAAKKPLPQSLPDWIASAPEELADPRPWIIAPQLADPSNVGALIRNAAALGAGAVITGTSGASPWYRKAVRTSAGTLFRMPVIASPTLAQDLEWLKQQAGLDVVALALTETAIPVSEFISKERKVVLVLGGEGHGLSSKWLKRCHRSVEIPMARGVDSLNVATSAAVVLYHLSQSLSGR
ncbi:MAG: tRNA G18 (ribose-2'-O)-methylase SpoU [Verrucomicrobiales bacterium]|jgi:tRNA G18 (ribose-2'-O)-methylase SpoU